MFKLGDIILRKVSNERLLVLTTLSINGKEFIRLWSIDNDKFDGSLAEEELHQYELVSAAKHPSFPKFKPGDLVLDDNTLPIPCIILTSRNEQMQYIIWDESLQDQRYIHEDHLKVR